MTNTKYLWPAITFTILSVLIVAIVIYFTQKRTKNDKTKDPSSQTLLPTGCYYINDGSNVLTINPQTNQLEWSPNTVGSGQKWYYDASQLLWFATNGSSSNTIVVPSPNLQNLVSQSVSTLPSSAYGFSFLLIDNTTNQISITYENGSNQYQLNSQLALGQLNTNSTFQAVPVGAFTATCSQVQTCLQGIQCDNDAKDWYNKCQDDCDDATCIAACGAQYAIKAQSCSSYFPSGFTCNDSNPPDPSLVCQCSAPPGACQSPMFSFTNSGTSNWWINTDGVQSNWKLYTPGQTSTYVCLNNPTGLTSYKIYTSQSSEMPTSIPSNYYDLSPYGNIANRPSFPQIPIYFYEGIMYIQNSLSQIDRSVSNGTGGSYNISSNTNTPFTVSDGSQTTTVTSFFNSSENNFPGSSWITISLNNQSWQISIFQDVKINIINDDYGSSTYSININMNSA